MEQKSKQLPSTMRLGKGSEYTQALAKHIIILRGHNFRISLRHKEQYFTAFPKLTKINESKYRQTLSNGWHINITKH